MTQEPNENEGVGLHNHHQSTRQWPHVIGEVMKKLMGANVSTAMNFDNLEVNVPWAQGPGGRDLGGAKWTINGKIILTTEGHKSTGSEAK